MSKTFNFMYDPDGNKLTIPVFDVIVLVKKREFLEYLDNVEAEWIRKVGNITRVEINLASLLTDLREAVSRF